MKGFAEGFCAGLMGIFLMVCVWLAWDTFFLRLGEMSTIGRIISLGSVVGIGSWVGWKFLR